MTQFLALMKREYLEHRGAFVYAPALLLAIIGATLVSASLSSSMYLGRGLKTFEVSYAVLSAAWWVYLSATTLFYFAGSFSADKRNNSMLFWKSMPVSDFKMLMAKALAGLTQFPLMVFIAVLLTGLMLAATVIVLTVLAVGLDMEAIGTVLRSYGQLSLTAFVYFILAVLWYAPFWAWVGALSAVVGRWSIPIAILTPAVLLMLENVLFYGRLPQGGYVTNFLWNRYKFGFSGETASTLVTRPDPVDAGFLLGELMKTVDWTSMAGGLIFALVMIYGASQYRRHALGT